MGVTVAVTRVACNTGTGNQDIVTADLGGLTPKAALFIIPGATVDGTAASNAAISIGAATATDERWTGGSFCKDAQATTLNHCRGMTDECIAILTDSGAVDGEADFVTFITNGVRINWGNAPAAAYLLTVVLFAGTDLSAKAITFTAHATVDNTVDVTTVGFEAGVLFTACGALTLDDAADSGAHLIHGIVLNKASDEQYSHAFRSDSGDGTTDPMGLITDNYGSGVAPSGATTYYYAHEYGTFDAQGFSCTSRINGRAIQVGILALAFGGAVGFEGGIIDSPTSTGNQSVTDPNLTPQYVHVGVTQMPAINTVYTDANAGSFGISTFDGDDEYCTSIQSEDAQGTSDDQSLSDDTAVNLPDDDGTAAHIAAFVSLDANGWTWNFTATEGTAVKYWYLVIEEEAAAVGQPLMLRATTVPHLRQWQPGAFQ